MAAISTAASLTTSTTCCIASPKSNRFRASRKIFSCQPCQNQYLKAYNMKYAAIDVKGRQGARHGGLRQRQR
jgi:hypothetical protein